MKERKFSTYQIVFVAVMAALVWAYLHGLGLRESAAAALRAGKATVEYPGTNNPDLGVLVHG